MSDIFSLEMGLSSTLAANTRSYTCQDFSKLLATRKALRCGALNRERCYRVQRSNTLKKQDWRLASFVKSRSNALLASIDSVLRILSATKIIVETASFEVQLPE